MIFVFADISTLQADSAYVWILYQKAPLGCSWKNKNISNITLVISFHIWSSAAYRPANVDQMLPLPQVQLVMCKLVHS